MSLGSHLMFLFSISYQLFWAALRPAADSLLMFFKTCVLEHPTSLLQLAANRMIGTLRTAARHLTLTAYVPQYLAS